MTARRGRTAPVVLALAALGACAPGGDAPRTGPAGPEVEGGGAVVDPDAGPSARAALTLTVLPVGAEPPAGGAVAWVEVAADPDRRRRGLGGRPRLEPDHGMLFVYPKAAPRHFWMKDCEIALDIAFVGEDRRILRIATLPAGAGLPDPAIPGADSGGAALYVLEMESGWFAAHGVRAGDALDLGAALVGVAAR